MSRSADGRTLRRLLVGGARQIGAFIAQLFVLPVVANVLDGERMGAWALLGATSFLVGYVDLGLATAVQRSAVTDDHARTRRLVGLSILTQLLLLPPALVAAFLYLFHIPGAPPQVQAEADASALLVLAAGAALGLAQPYRMLVLARGGVRQVANARTVASFCQLALLLGGFAWAGPSLLVPSAALLTANGLDLALVALAARGIDPLVPLGPRRARDRTERRAALRDGAAAFSLNVAVSAALRIDLFVLSAVAPLALVGTYQVAGRAVDMAYQMARQATAAIMPDLGSVAERERALRIGTAVFAGVVASGMAALALVAQPLLVAVFDTHVAGHEAAIVIVLLSSAAMIMALYEVASAMVMLGGRSAWECATPIVAGSVLNLAISVSLASTYGVWAVAGSTVIGNLLTLGLTWRGARRILGWGPGRVLRTLLPGLLAAGAATAVGLALRGQVTGWPSSLGAAAVTVAAGAAVAALVMRRGAGDAT